MRSLAAILAVIVLAGGVAGGALWLQKTRASQAAGRSEAQLQTSEITTCKQHLKEFYAAWKRYRADHKGYDPPNVESLVPAYIKNPDHLICPTAERWQRERRGLEQGRITVKKRIYPVTYGFRWLIPGHSRPEKGVDKTPLIICTSHREAMYIASHGGKRTLDVTGSDAAEAGPILVVRHNGEVGMLLSGEE